MHAPHMLPAEKCAAGATGWLCLLAGASWWTMEQLPLLLLLILLHMREQLDALWVEAY